MCTLKEEAGGPGGGWKLGLGKTRRKKKMGARVSFVIAPPYTYTTRHDHDGPSYYIYAP